MMKFRFKYIRAQHAEIFIPLFLFFFCEYKVGRDESKPTSFFFFRNSILKKEFVYNNLEIQVSTRRSSFLLENNLKVSRFPNILKDPRFSMYFSPSCFHIYGRKEGILLSYEIYESSS